MSNEKFMKKHALKTGDIIEIKTKNQIHEGTVIPSKESDFITLKLKSGYNISVKMSDISNVKKTGSQKVGKGEAVKVQQDKSLPKISILHTGGTIAGRVDYKTGAILSAFEPEDLLGMFPELAKIGFFQTKLVGNILSGNLRFKNISKIAKAVENEIKTQKNIKGIIVSHGTDTLGYSAAALSFMLENLNIPVIFAAAQRSSDRGSSDAAMNLICAAKFIADSEFKGVGICMHKGISDDECLILPATKSRKLHTSRRDAFKAVNSLPIASVNYKEKKIKIIDKNSFVKLQGKFAVKSKMEEKVGILKSHPNLMPEQIDFFRKNKYKGLVIEGTGMGHIPVGGDGKENELNKKNLEAVKKLVNSGCVVVMTSQCIFGRINMHVYSYGVDLMGAGVISGHDMLPETAFVKLSWLLGNYSVKKVPELMEDNLRNELIERTQENEFDLE
ncbi:MAG: Glu-tRNA(Gln) amidotransferase subunit GatD [Candidatus Diapherotrites archaeon]